YRDVFNPCLIFFVIWFLTASFSSIDYDDFMEPWSPLMHVVVTISGISFWLGSLGFLKKSKVNLQAKKELPEEFSFVTYALFIICFSAFIIEWLNAGGGLAVKSSGVDGDIAGLHYGTIFLPFVAVILYFKVLNAQKAKTIDWLLIILIIASSLVLKLSRGDMMIYILSFLFLYSRYKKISFNIVLFGLVIFAAVSIGVMFVRDPSGESIVFTSTSNPYVSVFYSYIATCFANLNDYIRMDNSSHLLGNATFASFWTVLGIRDNMDTNWIMQLDMFNASVYIYAFYHDFKLFGVILFPFLIGFGLSKLYYNSIHNSSLWLLLLSVLQKAIFVPFFGNYFFAELVILYPYLLTYAIIFSQFAIKDIRHLIKLKNNI
ncbi:oligosaccharide repeat unit polymerase, partial [bacterium]